MVYKHTPTPLRTPDQNITLKVSPVAQTDIPHRQSHRTTHEVRGSFRLTPSNTQTHTYIRIHANTQTYTHTYMCAGMSVHHTMWNASLNKWWRCTLKQSIQLVHVSLSSCHSAVLGTQLGKLCYYSITHSSAPHSHRSHVSPALEWPHALPLQVLLTGLDKDGPPTPTTTS